MRPKEWFLKHSSLGACGMLHRNGGVDDKALTGNKQGAPIDCLIDLLVYRLIC